MEGIKKVVMIYTTHLAKIPPQPILFHKDLNTILYIKGLQNLYKRIEIETFYRTEYKVPTPIVDYKTYMNGLDRMD